MVNLLIMEIQNGFREINPIIEMVSSYQVNFVYLQVHLGNVAASFNNNLGNVHEGLGKQEKVLENHEKNLEMKLTIHGHDEPHTDTALWL